MNLRGAVGCAAICGLMMGIGLEVEASGGEEVEAKPRVMVVVGSGEAANAQKVIEEQSKVAELIVKGDWEWERGEAEDSLWEELGAEVEDVYFFQGPRALVEQEGRLWGAYLGQPPPAWEVGERADSIRQALLYSIRARLELGHDDEARQLMEGLVERWPGIRPNEERHPPVVTSVWESVSNSASATTGGEGSTDRDRVDELQRNIKGKDLWTLFEELGERYDLDALMVVGRGDCLGPRGEEMALCIGQISTTLWTWRPLEKTPSGGDVR